MKWMADVPPERQLLRAGPPGARRPVQSRRQQRLQHRAPAQLQQRRAEDRVRLRDAARPRRVGQARRIPDAAQQHRRRAIDVDSVGGTTYGGTGVYGAQIGGVWDALLGEGRNLWFFASSDWHNRGSFGPDDRRSTQDFYPGRIPAHLVMVRNGSDKLRPQTIVDGLRTGNAFAASGQLIDRLAFVACASYPGPATRSNAAVEAIAVAAATNNTDIDVAGCATMGEKLKVRPGAEIVVAIVVRDPAGTNYSPYTFPNPSLLQIGMNAADQHAGARSHRPDPRHGQRLQDAGRAGLRRRVAAQHRWLHATARPPISRSSRPRPRTRRAARDQDLQRQRRTPGRR